MQLSNIINMKTSLVLIQSRHKVIMMYNIEHIVTTFMIILWTFLELSSKNHHFP